ncbi:hypothetical protein Tcan_02471 [Toxocara canis]|uniref:Uncharacterized protein n=1 Tax=Toxocara canis TaxID=6265 RepID=A0A0B2UPE6_TOXCA|nr:hypothetical protein Tcan_02471 [Toxocara canis]
MGDAKEKGTRQCRHFHLGKRVVLMEAQKSERGMFKNSNARSNSETVENESRGDGIYESEGDGICSREGGSDASRLSFRKSLRRAFCPSMNRTLLFIRI